MANIKYAVIIFISLFLLNSCSKDEDELSCPETETVSMKINGELMQFQLFGRGIDYNGGDSGHTLSLYLVTGTYYPQQDTYNITLKLPYKKTGKNIFKEFIYLRIQNLTSVESDFVQSELQSEVTINRSTCFSATFSGRAVIDGKEVIITEGIINHVYSDPFED